MLQAPHSQRDPTGVHGENEMKSSRNLNVLRRSRGSGTLPPTRRHGVSLWLRLRRAVAFCVQIRLLGTERQFVQ